MPSLIHWISGLASDVAFADATFPFSFSDKKVMERKERRELQKNNMERSANRSNVYVINFAGIRRYGVSKYDTRSSSIPTNFQ